MRMGAWSRGLWLSLLFQAVKLSGVYLRLSPRLPESGPDMISLPPIIPGRQKEVWDPTLFPLHRWENQGINTSTHEHSKFVDKLLHHSGVPLLLVQGEEAWAAVFQMPVSPLEIPCDLPCFYALETRFRGGAHPVCLRAE